MLIELIATVGVGSTHVNIKGSRDTELSSQDRGIGRHIVPPHTTKRRTTNLKTKNKNSQKIKLYGSLTTKELKKKHSSRPVGGAERTCSKTAAGGPGQARQQLADPVRQWLADWVVPHSNADKPGGTTGE